MLVPRTATGVIGIGILDTPAGRHQERIFAALRGLWRRIVALPDRGAAIGENDLPAEFFRFPCF